MRAFQSAIALAISSLLAVACAATPESESTGESTAAQTTSACQSDSTCPRGDVCEPACPVIPNQPVCRIAGGTCEVACTRTSHSLSGSTFVSANQADAITFTSASEFSKTVGCPNTGIHCNHIQLITGTYVSNGTKITLTPTTGTKDTLTVESHCYEGLFDNGLGVELYPAPASN